MGSRHSRGLQTPPTSPTHWLFFPFLLYFSYFSFYSHSLLTQPHCTLTESSSAQLTEQQNYNQRKIKVVHWFFLFLFCFICRHPLFPIGSPSVCETHWRSIKCLTKTRYLGIDNFSVEDLTIVLSEASLGKTRPWKLDGSNSQN